MLCQEELQNLNLAVKHNIACYEGEVHLIKAKDKGENRSDRLVDFLDQRCGLVERNVPKLTIDTLSVDPGFQTNFPVHEIMLSHGGFHIENLCNLEALPSIGATIIALPLKLCYGEESPARVIAFLPH